MGIGVNADLVELPPGFACQGIKFRNRVDLIAEEIKAPGRIVIVGREQLNRIAAYAEGAPRKGEIIALILQGDELRHQLAWINLVPAREVDGHLCVGLDRADTVNARHRRHDDTIIPLQNGARRGVAHPVDLLIYARVFLDKRVRAGDVSFRLIIIIIADEIFDRIVREEGFKFGIKLRGEGLVRCHDQGGALRLLDDLRHGEGLAGAGHAKQDLIAVFVFDAVD